MKPDVHVLLSVTTPDCLTKFLPPGFIHLAILSCMQVFAALLHLMPQVGRQVSGGQITAPINSQTHHSLIAQHAKLVKRQEQLLQFQHRLLLSQGNAAGRIPIPSGAHG